MKFPTLTILSLSLFLLCQSLSAELTVPNIFGSNMVLQRNQENPIWGKAEPGDKIMINFARQSYETETGADGKWMIKLAPLPAGGPYQLSIKVEGKKENLLLQNILLGEVWVCSGQSNMGWSVQNSNNADVEVASANFPEIRLFNMPRKGTPEPQDDTDAQWVLCSPDSVGNFSAVGYFYGRRIHQALDVPVGLINNSWGGSAAEAWIPKEMLSEHDRYANYVSSWEKRVSEHTDEIQEKRLAEWQEAKKEHAKNGGRWPRYPQDPRYGQHRPGNIYNGGVLPIAGFGIRGTIWYQGETNASRAEDYQHLMTMVIEHYRELWGQEDFPFYWVQLADYHQEQSEPEDSSWPRLREAQTATMDAVDNTGQAVIIDIGEGRDIHPRNKQDVADRLVRWALVNDYGFDMEYRSPQFQSMEIVDVTSEKEDEYTGKAALITFDYVSGDGLRSFDTAEVVGFAIAGEDQQFVWAEAEVVGKAKNQVRVWSESVAEPVAVRYAWAMNPAANLQDRNGLAATPFRTDDWPAPAKEE